MGEPPVLSTFLVKLTARCDLACDYCYVFEHADQSWRGLPPRMRPDVRRAVAARIGAYAGETGLRHVNVVFHGGEPLLVGAPALAEFADDVRARLPAGCVAHVGVQTNGLRLDAPAVEVLAKADIAVSVSLDGPASANDRHRLTAGGKSSFDRTVGAIERLRRHPEIFSGVIAVIDADNDPRELLAFFAGLQVPRLDLLLPDATHDAPPPGRDRDPDRYRRWLIEAFDIWFDEFGVMPLRTFDALVGAVAGVDSPTDAFGFGDVSLTTIETDGSYHDLDVLKITREGETSTGSNVFTSTVSEVASSERLAAHRRLLRLDGLSDTCQRCPEVDVCGGGAVPHRYRGGSFDQPSVYCDELAALISHVRQRVLGATRASRHSGAAGRNRTSVATVDAMLRFDDARASRASVQALHQRWHTEQAHELRSALAALGDNSVSADDIDTVALRPSAVLWAQATNAAASGRRLQDLRGRAVDPDPSYVRDLAELCRISHDGWPSIHRNDRWLRLPFGHPIEFEEAPTTEQVAAVREAFDLLASYSSAVAMEMRLLCQDVQLIRDSSAHGSKVVSFSDDLVPGAIYIGVTTDDGPVDVVDIADSLIHEYRHQKLYLLERETVLVADDSIRVQSPWRDDLRPPSGVVHACFVFVELLQFWRWVDRSGASPLKAEHAMVSADRQLDEAWSVLDGVDLTLAGRALVEALRTRQRAGAT